MNTADRLIELATLYNREARRCSRARAYLGASVMQVSALEAALQAMCFMFPREVKNTTTYQRKRFRGKRNRALEFSLCELVSVTRELAWFPDKRVLYGGIRADLYGFVNVARDIRNHVHPGKWARKHKNAIKIDKAMYEAIAEIFDVATSWLRYRVEQRLLKDEGRRNVVIKPTPRAA